MLMILEKPSSLLMKLENDADDAYSEKKPFDEAQTALTAALVQREKEFLAEYDENNGIV